MNNILLATGTLTGLVASLDFLSPYTAALNRTIYTVSSTLVIMLIFAALAPRMVNRCISILGFQIDRLKEGAGSNRWVPISIVAGLFLFSSVGLISVAMASQGGILASKSQTIRSWQEEVLQMRKDIADVKTGVDAANSKLDTLVENSKDPQKDVVSRGYSFDGNGLAKAIEQNDAVAVGLFAKSVLKITNGYPMWRVLKGKQPWNAQIVSLLSPEMFQHPEACDPNVEYAVSPTNERIAQYKRLCDTTKAVARLEMVLSNYNADKQPRPLAVEEQVTKYRETLALLKK
jgi:hypothetical protein